MANTAEAEEELQTPEPVEPPQAGPVQVDLDDTDADDDAGASTEEKPSRRDRRSARNTEHLEKRASALADERTAELRRELAEVRGQLQGISSSRPAPVAVDAYEQQIGDLQEQQQMLVQSMQSDSMTKEQVLATHKRWRDLENKAVEMRTQRAVERQWNRRQENPQDVENKMLQAEYPDIFGNEPMRLRALAELQDMSQRGKPINIVTAREAAEATRRRYGTGRPAAPSDIERQRYTGTSAQAGAGGTSRTFTPTLGQLRTARAYTQHTPDIDDAERVRRWVRDVAKPAGLVK